MVMDVNYTCCGDNFAIYTNIEILCFTPEANIMSCVNYNSFLKELNLKRNLKLQLLVFSKDHVSERLF